MRIPKTLEHIGLFLLALSASGATSADVVTVVSTQSTVASLTVDQVSSLFLGKSGTSPDGERLVPINLPEGAPARDEFQTRVIGKSSTQIKAYWSMMIFSGKGRPPLELPDNVAVRKYVATHPGTIGYLDRDAVDSSVRIVTLPDRR